MAQREDAMMRQRFPAPPEPIEWVHPWETLDDPAQQRRLCEELQRELPPEHPLYGIPVRAVASFVPQDDHLFVTAQPEFPLAVVHLTYSGRTEVKDRPAAELFRSWDEWLGCRFLPDLYDWALTEAPSLPSYENLRGRLRAPLGIRPVAQALERLFGEEAVRLDRPSESLPPRIQLQSEILVLAIAAANEREYAVSGRVGGTGAHALAIAQGLTGLLAYVGTTPCLELLRKFHRES